MEILILRHSGGNRASVEPAFERRSLPPGTVGRVIGPGESYWGMGYDEWKTHLGSTIELPAVSGASRPPHTVATRIDLSGDWRTEVPLVADPDPGSEYGYHTGEKLRPCTREQLIAQCTAMPATLLVWTPDSSGMVPPESVPFLVDALARARLRRARRDLWWCSIGLVVTLTVYVAWLPAWVFRSMLVLFPAFLAVGLLGAMYDFREARRTDARAFQDARAWHRHASWVRSQPRRYTYALLGLLALVYLAQTFAGREVSIELAGLLKPAVWSGEAWRLLTASLLHANFFHLWMNGAALLAVGHLVEVHSRREHLPLVFLVSALTGSVASLVLYPNTTSVGASGGLMGAIGLLLVVGWRRRDSLPPGFVGTVVFSIGATAALGLVGYAVVDNAAHLGGLTGGAALGHLLDRRGVLDPGKSARTRVIGLLAFGVLLAGAATVSVTIHGPDADRRRQEFRQERIERLRPG
ncbi:MAG TPA: rhomboid family intramembrane serine protease [Longimicrobiaceae bacterium]|nr:rhomboid family intramembrane serine protease [Longimicrobiaceae bacterium]